MQLLRGRTTGISTLAVSPDSRLVLAASVFAPCHVWDLSDAKPKPRMLVPGGGCGYITFSSATTLSVCVREVWWRYDLAANTQVKLVFPAKVRHRDAILHASGDRLTAHPFYPTGVRYLADDELSGRELCQLRDTVTDQIVTTFERPRGEECVEQYVFTPDGGKLFMASRHHVTVYACPQGGPPLLEFALPKGCTLHALAVHPGGRVLATVEDQRTVTLRDADTLQPLRSYDFAMPRVTCVAFTPDGTRCAVGNSRGKVLLFDVE